MQLWLHFITCHTLVLAIIPHSSEDQHGLLRSPRRHRVSRLQALQQPAVDEQLRLGVDSPARKVKNQMRRAARAPRTSYNMMRNVTGTLMDTFMPGYAVDLSRFGGLLLFVTFASIWLSIYFSRIYTSDRAEDSSHWEKQLSARRDSQRGSVHITPDTQRKEAAGNLVLVFHHPDFDYKDKDHVVKPSALERCFVSHSLNNLPKNLAREAGTTPASSATSQEHVVPDSEDSTSDSERTSDTGRSGFDGSTSGSDDEKNVKQLRPSEIAHLPKSAKRHGPCNEMTFETVRFAFLQDVYRQLQECGFDVQLFSSIDDDELFLCVGAMREEVLDHYMTKSGLRFQLQPSLIKNLGIKQPHEEVASSPPLLPYNPRDVKVLYDAKLIASEDSHAMYKAEFKHSHGSIVKSKDIIRFIFRELSTVFDLDAAQENGLLVDWYPVHESTKRLNKLYLVWADLSLLHDLSMVQPIARIRNYFGAMIAFNFAWNGTYCKCLLALLPIAACISLANTQILYRAGYHGGTSDNQRVIGFSLILAIWSRLAHNMWLRERSFFRVLFDVNDKDLDSEVCPQFHGAPEPSPVDLNKMEIQYSATKYVMRRFLSNLFTFTYSAVVCAYTSAFMHRATANSAGMLSFWANTFLVIQLKVFQIIYNYLSVILTDWENHKHHLDYYNSHLWKQVFFQFVNYYVPFFFLAVHQTMSQAGCPEQGCLVVLQSSLNSTLVILGLFRMGEVAFAAYLVRYKLNAELQSGDEGSPRAEHSPLEAQAKYPKYHTTEQIETMLELVLALGYVLIFGAVAFGTVLFCFLVFFIQLRASAFLLTTNARRPLPRASLGIGAWEDVVDVIMKIGVLFEALLIVTFDASFGNAAPVTKLMGIIIFWCSVFLTWYMVDLLCPSPDSETKLLEHRRHYTVKKLMQKTGHLLSSNVGNGTWAVSHELTLEEVRKIPHYDGTPGTQRSTESVKKYGLLSPELH